MKFHKNINVWYRLLINLFDFGLFVTLTILNYYFLMVHKGVVKAINFYSFIIFSTVILLVLFLLIPLFYSSRTIGMLIFRVQIIPAKKMTPWALKLLPLRRNAFALIFWFLIILIPLTLVMPNEFNDFSQFIIKKHEGNYRFQIASKLIIFLSGFWFTLILINYIMEMASRTRLGLFDRSTNTRVTYLKHYSQSSYLDEIKLLPFKSNNEAVIYIKK